MPKIIKRKEILLYLNTDNSKPTGEEVWSLYGKKTVSSTYNYNVNSTTETYITEDNADTVIDSYNVVIEGDMKCYYGDPVYDFINDLRYNLAVGSDAETKALLIDHYIDTSGGFQAQVFNCSIAIKTYGGEGGVAPTITFNVNLNGDPKQGSVTFEGETPTFTAQV